MTKKVAHLDLDAFKYSLSSVGETRSIKVIHKTTGWEAEFKTRTEFWGHHKKKAGGWLAKINEKKITKGQEPAVPEDFEIIDQQTLKNEPIANILHSVKQSVDAAVRQSGADTVFFYLGEGDSFRVEKSTILKYKGNRDNAQKPMLFDDVVDFMVKKYRPEIVTGYEVDDVITMRSYGHDNHFCICLDKDAYGSGSNVFNFTKPEEGIVETNNFGKLWIDSSGKTKKVRGYGTMFKLWQVCSLDDSDNYRANCASDTEWGEMSAYYALKDCENTAQLFQSATNIFKHLYPEPKIITGWRGDEIKIDWLYVFQECFDMAHMHRWENDFVNVESVLKRLRIDT